ncbi:MAG TPA: hypothetical protein EYN71_04445 [Flavobacteriales bacterium]|nr:hypothetical protein [Flavobacteriales bacterium]
MTFLEPFSRIIAPIFQRCILNSLKIISLNIKKASPEDIGKLYAEGDALATKLALLKNTLGLQELMYLSTCNRTEFLIKTNSELDENYLKSVLLAFNDNLGQEEIADLVGKLDVYEGSDAILHLTNVASSLDSMVVGEREITGPDGRLAQTGSPAQHCYGKENIFRNRYCKAPGIRSVTGLSQASGAQH